MSLTIKSKRFFAAVAVIISAGGLMVTLTSSTFASATGSVGSSASVGTVPLCVWQLSGVTDSVTLSHPDASNGGDAHIAYVGDDFILAGSSSQQASIYVGPAGQSAASSTDVDNCSFYNEFGQGISNTGAIAQLAIVETATAKFRADYNGSEDTAMSFPLNGTTPTGSTKARNLSLTITPANCYSSKVGSAGDNWVKESGTTGLNSGSSPIPLATLSKANTTTSSTCSFSSSLSVYIPGGLTPAHPGNSYTYTGPTLTTTLSTNVN